ncbi:3-oxo-5-alpha-steroid 4-dehydrogenase-domain-containing protein [Suillus clintonianus]|uniref:3-oxo-5-alpha-steroid 4-dehydrogenase-domain-containing protein n=1 Tax=Suillus clintonianus TaxID=1904413 RepID=UPI001B8801CD|nr:3-oxo-5-alpha-steroid 4-dehydrogenase-domain-containing protein [Suillus clintonianus]KAG2153282.1 3-oxo-5-alpha-steroid 4-dehydrogenase-domain-containing protein [Suillus clintonianus]
MQSESLYDAARKWFFLIPPIMCPLQFLIDAPFGRFAPSNDSIFVVDGIKSWIVMELVSPMTFIAVLFRGPWATSTSAMSGPQVILAGLFIIHYLNRAIISPLRTPSRSKAHISVSLSGIIFNLANGALMGTYISSPTASAFLEGAFSRPYFWAGITLWACGFAGNILHDEVLLNIRRNSKAKGKRNENKVGKEHYAIPHGYLYRYISYPNYFCEWSEWFGYALAAAPLPALMPLTETMKTIQPPWLFFWAEVFMMIPRAYKGHQWYHKNFPEYPTERKAVVPFIY